MRTLYLASFGLALLAASAHAGPKTWDQSWNLTTQADVHVISGDAHVRVHTGPAGQVKVHVEYDLRHWGVVMGGGEPAVVFEHKDDQIWITIHDPKTVGVIGAVDVRSGDGRVTLDELDGRLRARTKDGHLSCSGRFDALDLGAGDGRVDAIAAPGSQPTSDWNVETGDGAVSLRIPHDINTLLDARTRDGHINVSLPIPVQGRLEHKELIGELNNGGPSLRIRTGDGSITLALSD